MPFADMTEIASNALLIVFVSFVRFVVNIITMAKNTFETAGNRKKMKSCREGRKCPAF